MIRKFSPYLYAMLLVAGASLLKLLIPGIGEQAPTMLYLLVIFSVANMAGFYPALFAAVLAALAVDFLFASHSYRFTINSAAAASSIGLLVEGVAVAWLVDKGQRFRRQLEISRAQLKESNDRIINLMEEVLKKDIGGR